MRTGKKAVLLALASPLLIAVGSGCANFWQAPTSPGGGGGCTTSCTTATSGNFYMLNAGTTPQVIGDEIVAGKLTAITGSPWTLQATPYAMAVAKNGEFLTVSTTSGVFAYPLTNGVLGTGTVVSSDQAYAVQVDATSSWLIEAIPQTGGVTVGAVPINSSTGATSGTEQTATFSVTNAAVQAGKMVLSGDNANIFIALGAGGTIVVPFNPTVSAGNNPLGSKANLVAPASASGSALSVGVAPGTAPGLFYVGETLADSAGTTGGVRVFNYSSLGGTLTQAAGSPLTSGGLAPNAILPIGSGSYVYVANGQGTTSAGNVTGFTITPSGTTTITYSLAKDTSTATGIQPLSLAEDSTDTFVFEVGSLGSPYFDSFTFDTTTPGQLDTQIVSTSAASFTAIVATP